MRKSTILMTLGICLILCLLIFPIAAYIICYFLPREYASFVAIQIEVKYNPKRANSLSGYTDSDASTQAFVADQIPILRGKAILGTVIDELGLVDKWSVGRPAKLTKDEAYQKLLKRTDVIQTRDTDFITIRVTDVDRQEAADIANTIAIIYQKQRRDDLDQSITNALSEMKKQDVSGQQYDTESKRLRFGFMVPPVRIWERAEPSRFPSSPNVTVILKGGTALGFLCALLGIVPLLIGARLKRMEPPPIPISSSGKVLPPRDSGWPTEI